MDWELKLAKWEEHCKRAKKFKPLKEVANSAVKIIPIAESAAKNLRWKALKWVVKKDNTHEIKRGFLKKPFKYALGYLRSILSKKPYREEGDFFLYGIKSVAEFKKLLGDGETIFVLGFSYCHKPFECPAGRFNDCCFKDATDPVCKQCFIGKAFNFIPCAHTVPLVIPTAHYIGRKIFEIIERHPDRRVIFLITACEMTLRMFADYGNMVGLKGLGVRLSGRICNTIKAFELSEEGIKPGLTVVGDSAKEKIFNLLYHRHRKCIGNKS